MRDTRRRSIEKGCAQCNSCHVTTTCSQLSDKPPFSRQPPSVGVATAADVPWRHYSNGKQPNQTTNSIISINLFALYLPIKSLGCLK